MNTLEMMALTEKQQEKVQACENKLQRRIVDAKKELIRNEWMNREEVRVKECFNKKLVISRLTWGGHVEIMGDEKVAKRADT